MYFPNRGSNLCPKYEGESRCWIRSSKDCEHEAFTWSQASFPHSSRHSLSYCTTFLGHQHFNTPVHSCLWLICTKSVQRTIHRQFVPVQPRSIPTSLSSELNLVPSFCSCLCYWRLTFIDFCPLCPLVCTKPKPYFIKLVADRTDVEATLYASVRDLPLPDLGPDNAIRWLWVFSLFFPVV
jgi:hypothetical protein